MSDIEWLGAILGLAVLVLVTAGLLWFAAAGRQRASSAFARHRDGSVHAICAVCAAGTEVGPESLVQLSPAEKALVVRERPNALGKDLVEFVCPHCDASHCLSAGRETMGLIGVNLYDSQHFQVQCKECRKMLEAPPWPPGAYDGRWREAPGDIDGLGMVCPYCGATCCAACCKTSTRNRTGDGSLLCPRCYRGPLDQFFHPAALHTRRN